KPENYFKGLVRNAAREIMSQIGARRRKGDTTGTPTGAQQDGEGSGAKGYRAPPPPASPAEDAEVHDTVKFILTQANPRARTALELCYWDDWSLQSIAEHLG